ncbi:MAG: aspartate--tRNA ligase [Ruminococcaceae bacterium]|nr:aspartate--tRNA ligase [Oscillospiraceae bacterium]
MKRTKYCGNFNSSDIGQVHTVTGWVQRTRNLGGLLFIDLRDRTGIVQLTFDEAYSKELFDKAYSIRSEFVLQATGKVRGRGEGAINKTIATGEVEILVDGLTVLSVAQTPPFEIVENCQTNEELRLKYRYLDLRRPDVQRCLMLRHRVVKIARDYYDKNGFLEIETPIMTKSTPEGARDYLVPSRVHPGSFYALPQSPQLYKQLLMLSGYDRYMQIARCFRDEDLRADRQPEFTQIDLEMSFIDENDIMSINEGFIKKAFEEALGIEIQTPFLRMPYKEAMDRFGSDKPDIRFGFELCDISKEVENCGFKVFDSTLENGGSVRCINIKGFAQNMSRREIDGLAEFVKTYGAKGLAWMKSLNGEVTSSFAKFITDEQVLENIKKKADFEDNDVIFVVADKNSVVYASLGALRCEIAKRLQLINEDEYKFLWVTEFPLVEFDEEENRCVAMHHPFTAPMEEDIEYMETEPLKVRARAYDMVLNGVELGGGSIRIHSQELQQKMFRTLGFTNEEAQDKFGFLLNAFKYGVPPHGGLAFGLDRLIMLMAKRDSIRDVIAFPKVQNASELMNSCPSEVEAKQLEELSIKIDIKQN